MAGETAHSSKRNRTRSPSYPYLDLQGALEKAAVLWHAEGRHAASISVVMQHWGYKEESSTGYSCVAALKKFGLVDHEGMGEMRRIKLSGLALRILLDDNPQSDERRAALREAALGPRIHAELWERYGIDLPSDQSLKRFLVLERSFNEASVDELLAEYKQTMAFAALGRGAGEGTAAASAGGVGTVPRLPTLPVPPAAAAGSPPARATPPAVERVVKPPPRDLFGERDAAAYDDDDGGFAEEALPVRRPPVVPAPAAPTSTGKENGNPWSGPRRELPVPLDNGLVASVPYPMTEEDFLLLIDTLQLWKKRLVQPASR